MPLYDLDVRATKELHEAIQERRKAATLCVSELSKVLDKYQKQGRIPDRTMRRAKSALLAYKSLSVEVARLRGLGHSEIILERSRP